MNIPQDRKYTASHEWVRVEGNVAWVGITDHAQSELGDIVFVELPEVGRALKAGESFGTIEAVKTVADLYAPLGGKVVETNSALGDDAAVINQDPYGKGWILKLEAASAEGEFLDAAQYAQLVGGDSK